MSLDRTGTATSGATAVSSLAVSLSGATTAPAEIVFAGFGVSQGVAPQTWGAPSGFSLVNKQDSNPVSEAILSAQVVSATGSYAATQTLTTPAWAKGIVASFQASGAPAPTPSPTPSLSPAPSATPIPTPAPVSGLSIQAPNSWSAQLLWTAPLGVARIQVLRNGRLLDDFTFAGGANSSAPYLNGLANSNALGTQVYAISHPSLPNYLALAGGSTYGVTTDCTTCYVSGSNLADQIEASGRTFRAYLEGMPSPCFVGDSYPYMQKHNPWIYFDDMRTNATRCAADLVPYSQLSTDLTNNTVPNFVWITPNMCNDMHDCSIASGDAWLSQQVPAILNSAAFKNGGVLFLTWDEGNTYAACCTDAAGGRVATIVVSPLGKTAYQSSVPETLYGLLRTIEDAWSLPELGDASCSCTTVMREYFR